MRNILECFFGFMNKEDYKYDAFKRYINRKSRSDMENIEAIKGFDKEIFMKCFKSVFIDNGYEKHYDKYMKEEENQE